MPPCEHSGGGVVPNYLVTWDIVVRADSPIHAAEIAHKIHRDPESRTEVYAVADEDGEIMTVDLLQTPART
jgi:hypothetical protein